MWVSGSPKDRNMGLIRYQHGTLLNSYSGVKIFSMKKIKKRRPKKYRRVIIDGIILVKLPVGLALIC